MQRELEEVADVVEALRPDLGRVTADRVRAAEILIALAVWRSRPFAERVQAVIDVLELLDRP